MFVARGAVLCMYAFVCFGGLWGRGREELLKPLSRREGEDLEETLGEATGSGPSEWE